MHNWVLATTLGLGLLGCTTTLTATAVPEDVHTTVAVGRAVAVITGERHRIYEPAVRSFEIQNRETGERFTVEIQSDNERFMLSLPTGEYELTRVQINEGPFLSMAQLATTFSVKNDAITYVGTWRFGVDSPKYGRMVNVSMMSDEEDRERASEFVVQAYPLLDRGSAVSSLPQPSALQARLYEVMPYPNVPRYFRRHWW